MEFAAVYAVEAGRVFGTVKHFGGHVGEIYESQFDSVGKIGLGGNGRGKAYKT